MPVRYKIPAMLSISSISHEGVEHKVVDGYLHVEMMTPTLEKELAMRGINKVDEEALARAKAEQADEPPAVRAPPLTDAELAERDYLLKFLDRERNTQTDRRLGIRKLRENAGEYPTYVPFDAAMKPADPTTTQQTGQA